MKTENRLLEYTKKLETEPESNIFARIADIHRKSGDVVRAIEVCEKGIESNPEYVTGHLILGRCYLERGVTDKAQSCFEKALIIDRKNILALKMLGDIFISQGRKPEGVLKYVSIINIDPLDSSVLELINRYKTADTSFDTQLSEQKTLETKIDDVMDEVATTSHDSASEITSPVTLIMPEDNLDETLKDDLSENISLDNSEEKITFDQSTGNTILSESSPENNANITSNSANKESFVNNLGEEELIVEDLARANEIIIEENISFDTVETKPKKQVKPKEAPIHIQQEEVKPSEKVNIPDIKNNLIDADNLVNEDSNIDSANILSNETNANILEQESIITDQPSSDTAKKVDILSDTSNVNEENISISAQDSESFTKEEITDVLKTDEIDTKEEPIDNINNTTSINTDDKVDILETDDNLANQDASALLQETSPETSVEQDDTIPSITDLLSDHKEQILQVKEAEISNTELIKNESEDIENLSINTTEDTKDISEVSAESIAENIEPTNLSEATQQLADNSALNFADDLIEENSTTEVEEEKISDEENVSGGFYNISGDSAQKSQVDDSALSNMTQVEMSESLEETTQDESEISKLDDSTTIKEKNISDEKPDIITEEIISENKNNILNTSDDVKVIEQNMTEQNTKTKPDEINVIEEDLNQELNSDESENKNIISTLDRGEELQANELIPILEDEDTNSNKTQNIITEPLQEIAKEDYKSKAEKLARIYEEVRQLTTPTNDLVDSTDKPYENEPTKQKKPFITESKPQNIIVEKVSDNFASLVKEENIETDKNQIVQDVTSDDIEGNTIELVDNSLNNTSDLENNSQSIVDTTKDLVDSTDDLVDNTTLAFDDTTEEQNQDVVKNEFYNVAGDSAALDKSDDSIMNNIDKVEMDESLSDENNENKEDEVEGSDQIEDEEIEEDENTVKEEIEIKDTEEKSNSDYKSENLKIEIPESVASPTLAELFYKQGQISQAIEVYKFLTARHPENEKYHKRLSDLVEESKNTTPQILSNKISTGKKQKAKTVKKTKTQSSTLVNKKPLSGKKINKKRNTNSDE